MVFLLLVSVLFLAICYRVNHYMYTGNNLDNYDKGKLILMLQVRQIISLETSHPYLPFCRHIIPILNFILIDNIFLVLFLLLIKLYPCNNVVLVNQN